MLVPHPIFYVALPFTYVQNDLLLMNTLTFIYLGVHHSNGSVGPEGYKYFLNAVGLFPRLRELPVALNLRTYISLFFFFDLLERKIDGWMDGDSCLCYLLNFFFAVTSTTYKSVLELEIIKENDPVSGLCYSRFYSKEKT